MNYLYFQTEFEKACKQNDIEKANEIYTNTKHLNAIDIHANDDQLFKHVCQMYNTRTIEFLFNMSLNIDKPFTRKSIEVLRSNM